MKIEVTSIIFIDDTLGEGAILRFKATTLGHCLQVFAGGTGYNLTKYDIKYTGTTVLKIGDTGGSSRQLWTIK